MSLTHPALIIALMIFPLLPNKNKRVRLVLLGGLSLLVLGLSFDSILPMVVMGIWIIFPFVLAHMKAPRSMIILGLLVGFVYLNGYTAGLASWGFIQPGFRLIGLSYIVFRQIDYLLNWRDEAISMERGLVYWTYITSFYTLLAGPIQRFQAFEAMMSTSDFDLLPDASLKRLMTGFVKVVFISALLKEQADAAFVASALNPIWLLIFAMLNTLYLYFNFSGYVDVVVGAAKLAGLTLPENFNQPWLARDLVDFWSRWHMTLTSWLTDYVHNPILTMINRKERISIESAQIVAITITFLIVGLWHGSTINYLIYAVLQALGLGFNAYRNRRLIRKRGSRKQATAYRNRPVIRFMERVVTLTYVVISFSFVGYDMLGMLLRIVK